MTERAIYQVQEDGWVAGRRVSAGDRLELTATAAKYERVAPVPPEKPASTGRKLKGAA